MSAGVKTNAKVLARAFLKAGENVRRQFRDLVEDTAQGVEGDIRAKYASGKPGVVTGELKRGVRRRTIEEADGAVQVVSSTAPHAHLVEFGSEKSKDPERKGHGRMPAFPTVLPAAKKWTRPFEAKAERMLWNELKEIGE